MQKVQLKHKRFIQLSMMQSLSEQEWCVKAYTGRIPATNLFDDEHERPKHSHT
jgi:hypothetical protein